MRTAGQWIRERREALKKTREELAAETKLGLATLARVEKDVSANRSTVRTIGIALGLTDADSDALAAWAAGAMSENDFVRRAQRRADGTLSAEAFLESRGLRPMALRLPGVEWMTTNPGEGTPVLGEVTAGGMVESIVFDVGEQPERVPMIYPSKARTYALRIRGDSMSPEYRPGEILIVEDATRDELEDGEDAVIQCDGGADGCSTFKRVVFLGNGRVKLVPLNAAYKSIEIQFDNIVRIGKVLVTVRPSASFLRGSR